MVDLFKVDSNNLNDVLKSHEIVFVLFQMLTCPFCVTFTPIYIKYSKSERGKFVEAVIDDYNNPLWDEYHIDYVPTVILFHRGKQIARKDAVSMVGLSEGDMEDLVKKVRNIEN